MLPSPQAIDKVSLSANTATRFLQITNEKTTCSAAVNFIDLQHAGNATSLPYKKKKNSIRSIDRRLRIKSIKKH
jgi:hypothetical protein